MPIANFQQLTLRWFRSFLRGRRNRKRRSHSPNTGPIVAKTHQPLPRGRPSAQHDGSLHHTSVGRSHTSETTVTRPIADVPIRRSADLSARTPAPTFSPLRAPHSANCCREKRTVITVQIENGSRGTVLTTWGNTRLCPVVCPNSSTRLSNPTHDRWAREPPEARISIETPMRDSTHSTK